MLDYGGLDSVSQSRALHTSWLRPSGSLSLTVLRLSPSVRTDPAPTADPVHSCYVATHSAYLQDTVAHEGRHIGTGRLAGRSPAACSTPAHAQTSGPAEASLFTMLDWVENMCPFPW